MRKITKDKNVLRAMTIGIAVMMATAATPMSALAAEGPGADTNEGNSGTNESSSENTENTSSEEDNKASVADIANACGAAVTTSNEAKDLTGAISDVIVTSDGKTTIPEEDAKKILDNLPTEDDFDKGVAEKVSAAKTTIEAALVYDGNVATFTNSGSDDMDVAEADIRTMYSKTSSVFDSADAAITDAKAANDVNASEEEARAAAGTARTNLATAESNLATIENAYSEAEGKVLLAQSEFDAADAQYKKAVAELENARKDLKEAKTNATAANEKMKGVKAIADNLEDQVKNYGESVEELKEIRDQYYSMLVYYHRSLGSAVYNKDGSLNIEESSKSSKIKTLENDRIYELGRYLTEQVVEYMVMHDENVDPEKADFKYGVEGVVKGGTNKLAQKGVVFTNSNGEHQTITTEKSKKDKSGETIERGEYYTVKWNYPGQNDGGRTNFVAVSYKDKNDKEVTRYFNYILKSSDRGDLMDVENGICYLAEITKDENGKYVANRVSDNAYVMDDYQKLQKAIAATEYLEQYEAVKKAVDDAANKVDELEKKIAYLESIKIDDSRLTELAGRLEIARGQLAEYSATKEELEVKVAEARAAVAAIDLSRFGTGSEGADADDDTSDVFTFAGQQPGQTVAGINAIMGTTANVQPGAAANGNNTVVIGQRQTPRSATFKTNDNKSDKKLTKLDNNQVPLAAMQSEDETSMSWWWLLIIFLFGAAGREMYKKHQERLEAKAAAKNNDQNL